MTKPLQIIPDCAVILPVYNPAEDWHLTVIEQYSKFQQQIHDAIITLVIVDDGTESNRLIKGIEEIRKLFPGLLFIESEENRGKGNALRKAVAVTSAGLYILTDIDFPYSIESMCAVYNSLHLQTTDIAAGNRAGHYYQHINTGRKLLSRLLRFCIRLLFNISIDDTQCGLKGFSEKAKPLFLNCVSDRYLYDLEFIVRAYKAKDITISAVPVQLRQGIVLRKIALQVLLQEVKSFLNILNIRYSR